MWSFQLYALQSGRVVLPENDLTCLIFKCWKYSEENYFAHS